jgi:hypothetical protein
MEWIGLVDGSPPELREAVYGYLADAFASAWPDDWCPPAIRAFLPKPAETGG